MKFIFGLLIYNLKLKFQYGTAEIFKLIAYFVFFSIQITLWNYVFKTDQTHFGTNINFFQYFTISTVLAALTSLTSDRLIQSKYQDGSLIFYLNKPVSMYRILFFEDISRAILSFMFNGIPLIILGILIFNIFKDVNTFNIVLFLVSTLFSFGLAWCIFYIIGISIVFLKNNEGLIQLRLYLIALFSGAIVPLYILPGPWQKIFYLLPFYNLIDTPTRILYSYDLNDIVIKLITQSIWFIIFLTITFIINKLAISKIEIAGG